MKFPKLFSSRSSGFARFTNAGGDFSFEAPAGWRRELHPDPDCSNIFQVSAPDGSVAITASGYAKKPGMSLREFADARYGAIDEVFKPVAQEQSLPQGYYWEYEGLLAGQHVPTYYVVCVRETATGFISLTIVTTRDDFVKNIERYTYVMSSVQA